MKKIFRFKHFALIKKQLGNLRQGEKHLPFFTHGKWSMHETLLFLLSISGAASVSISSFSLSDTTVQAFAKAIKSGYITKLDLLLNKSIKRNKLDVLLFAGNIVNRIGLADTHLKIITIENDKWKIVVNQSANSTINPAWESGVVSADVEIFKKYKKYLKKAFSESLPVWSSKKSN